MSSSIQQSTRPSLFFILLLSMMSSFAALSTDIMLPTLPDIANSFQVDVIQTQKVITWFFLGIFLGELMFGPLSDRFGRKPLILGSSLAFVIGGVVSLYASSFEYLLLGRIIQGFGAAGPKIVIRAMMRDLYCGAVLARVFSLVYTLFIFVPMVAPLAGQWLSQFGGWQFIFFFLIAFCVIATSVFAATQGETLAPEKRLSLKVGPMLRTSLRIFAHRKVFLLTMLTAIIFGMKLTYLSNAQQFFLEYYNIDEKFPLYFAFLATAIGSAFFLNSALVVRLGGYKLCTFAIALLCCMSVFLCVGSWIGNGIPPFWIFLSSLFGMFFSFGLLWGNVAALAMEYLGDVAGLGSTMISAGSSLVAFIFASILGTFYGPTLLPIAIGFVVLSALAAICFTIVVNSSHTHAVTQVA
ncbi:MAG: multidrug effflux MFS transporter [Pseudomonadota bacterium]|nr:multidrug effflux MFS transporter [Pseudomonadota bacterium]